MEHQPALVPGDLVCPTKNGVLLVTPEGTQMGFATDSATIGEFFLVVDATKYYLELYGRGQIWLGRPQFFHVPNW